MADLFKALGIFALVAVATMALAAAMIVRTWVRANRVAPGRRSPAPLSWLLSPRLPARLHRRLRRAVTVTDYAVGSIAPAAITLRDVGADLVDRAVTIDHWLVASAALHPDARRPQLAQLTAEVREVEISAARLHELSAEWRRRLDQSAASSAVPPPDLHQRMDAVEAALRELPTTSPGGLDMPRLPSRPETRARVVRPSH